MSEVYTSEPIPHFAVEHTTLGNLDITAIQIEHKPELWNQHKRKFEQILPTVDLVIPEYFTPEWKTDSKNTTIKAYTDIENLLEYFGQVEGVIAKNSKDVLVVDPAHDRNFAVINLSYMIEIAGGSTALLGAAKAFPKDKNPSQTSPQKGLTRRNFLRLVAGVGAGGVAAGMGNFGSYMAESVTKTPTTFPPNEATFRRAIIAQGLKQFASEQSDRLNVALIYPPTHWKQIKQFLTDPTGETYFNAFSVLKSIPAFKESFFLGRHYQWNEQAWIKKDSFEIK